MSSISIFDHNYLRYDRWFDENEEIFKAEVQALQALMPPSHTALEVGVGTGRFAGPLQVAYGVEPSHNMALLARSRGIHVCRALGEWLPYSSETFDCVTLITVLCFIEDKGALIEECSRVLKPRGDLLVGVIDKDSQLGAIYESRKAEDIFYRHASFQSVEHTIALIKEAGFELQECTQTICGMPYKSQGWDDLKGCFGEGSFVGIHARKPDV